MAEIVEGYKAPATTAKAGPVGDTSWISDLREDLRKEMIRELAMRRIKEQGAVAPEPQSRFFRIAECVAVGVIGAVVSNWLIKKLWGSK